MKKALDANNAKAKIKIQAHILEYIEGDLNLLLNNAKAVMFGKTDTYHKAIVENVMGGNFLIYDQDIEEFLTKLGTNPNNKNYDMMKRLGIYANMIATNGVRLLKQAKLI